MRSKLLVIGLLGVSASVLAAQGRVGGAGGGRAGRRLPPPGSLPADSVRPNRAVLEQRVQQRLAQMMKQQLGLTDAQMKKVQETNRKFEGKRRILMDQERDVRMSLRDEMARPDSARQGQVGALLERVTKVQHQRLDLLEEEQKELGTFLTPMQRAQYMGMEERVRQRMQEMRQQQLRGGRMNPPDGMDPMDSMGPGAMGRGGPPPDGGMLPPAGARLRRRPLLPPMADDSIRPGAPDA